MLIMTFELHGGPGKFCQVGGRSHFFSFVVPRKAYHVVFHLFKIFIIHCNSKTKTNFKSKGIYLVPPNFAKIFSV